VGNFCDAPLMYDEATGTLNKRLPFSYLGHFSRFIMPGARRMLTTAYTTGLECCGFMNPDGSFALVVLNRTSDNIDFDLTWETKHHGKRIASLDAPAHSIQTLCW
jgi:glucosylceramidase